MPSRVRRATFNTSAAGVSNLFGEHDLVEDVSRGHTALEDIRPDQLPPSVRTLPTAKLKALIAETAQRRAALKGRIEALADQRAEHLKERVAALPDATESLDHQLYETASEQAEAKSCRYDADAPDYLGSRLEPRGAVSWSQTQNAETM